MNNLSLRTRSRGFSAEPDNPEFQLVAATPGYEQNSGTLAFTPPEKAGVVSVAQSAPTSWTQYFPFPAGTAFEASALIGMHTGRGAVIKNGDGVLEVELHMPAKDLVIKKLEKADMTASITYNQDGPGNSGTIIYNGSRYDDPNITITSRGDKRVIELSKVIPGFGLEKLTMEPDGPREVDLTLFVDGDKYSLELKAVNLSGQQSVAFTAAGSWSNYFHFNKGDSFRVDGPLTYDGNGTVLEKTDDTLKFEIHMPEKSILGFHLPKTDMVLEVKYVQEGAGNKAKIDINGTVHDDPNVAITSKGNRRTIVPSIQIPNHNLEGISVSPDGTDEIDLDIKIDGREHDFDLERK